MSHHHGKLEASSDERWTIPIGGGVRRVLKLGSQPINAQMSYYCNVESQTSPGVKLRAQWTFFFPTRRFGVLRGLVVDVCLWHQADVDSSPVNVCCCG